MDGVELTSIPLLARLDEDDRNRLAGVCSEIRAEAGTHLVQEGDFGFAMFAIVDGTAEVTKEEEVIRTLGPGDVFGEIAVLAGGRRTATVTATTKMNLVAIMNRDVWRLEHEEPELGASLRQTIADCLAR